MPEASLEDARAAYRNLVKVWHPDRHMRDAELHRAAEAKMKRINVAYATLCSALARGKAEVPAPPPPEAPVEAAAPPPEPDTRELVFLDCAECGKDAMVPFQPRGDRPVYCSDCFSRVRSNSSGGF